MKIYSILGVQIANVPVQSNAEHERELMKSDFIRLEWSQSSFLELPCGSYIEYDGVKYRLLKGYKPEQQNTQQWDYSPEFQHPVMMLGTIPFILITGDTTSWQSADKETEWSWTGMAVNAINEVFVPFLNKYGADNADIGTGWTAVVSTDIKASETLTFQSMDFLSALSHAAQQFECEWHLDYENKILYFGHINITTEELVFEVGENVGNPEVRENNEGYYNAYIAKGSTRNISQVNDKGENIQLNKRLKLDPVKYPDGYIDRRKSTKEPLIVKELIYEDIYPSLDLYIYNPKARTRFLLDPNTGDRIEDEKDPTGYKRYSIWYVRLAYKLNGEWKDFEFSKDMLIGNLSCQFQGNENSTKYTSPLAGREFELTYHDSDQIIPADPVTGDTGISIKKGDYEIIYDENNGLIIPTTVEGGMYPRGDKYQSEDNNILRLYNIALPSEYTSKAQEELETQALKDIEYWESDRNNYEFNSNPIAFKADMPKLFIGRGVVYKNDEYQLNTRISKLVQKIDFPYEVEITVGNEEIKGNTTTMREQLQMVVSAMNNGMGGMSVEQFKKMLNIYASQIFDRRFLSKLNPDTAAGIITFLQGLISKGKVRAEEGVIIGQFVQGFLGTGGSVDAKGNAEFESIFARSFISTPELRYNRITVTDGELWITNGNGIIESIDTENMIITLHLEENDYASVAEGDLCRGIYNNFGTTSEYQNLVTLDADDCGFPVKAGFFTSYFRVAEILEQSKGKCYFRYELRNSSTPHPCAQMKFAQYGNDIDETRQASAFISSIGHFYFQSMEHVDTWAIQQENITIRWGWVDGFPVKNTDGTTSLLRNYGLYVPDNIYFGNAVVQLDPKTIDSLRKEMEQYSIELSNYTDVITVDDAGNVIDGLYKLAVEGDLTTKYDYRIAPAVFVKKGNEYLIEADSGDDAAEGTYKMYVTPKNCTAEIINGTVCVTAIDNIKDGVSGTSDDVDFDYDAMRKMESISVVISVMCEGIGSITKEFKVAIKHDSKPYISMVMDNQNASVSWNTKAQKYIGLPYSFNVTAARANDLVPINKVSIVAPEGVTVTSGMKDGVVVLAVTSLPRTLGNVTDIKVTATATYAGISYEQTLVHTLNRYEDVNVYELKPSVTQVVASVNTSGEKVADVEKVTCSVLCSSSDDKQYILTAEQMTIVKAVIKYSIDDSATLSELPADGLSVSPEWSKIVFHLLIDGSEIDSQDVPVMLNGVDGNGIEYVFLLTTEDKKPTIYDDSTTEAFQSPDYCPYTDAAHTRQWTDEPTGVGINNRYEWVAQRKKQYGKWLPFSEAKKWTIYAMDGTSPYSLDLTNESSQVLCDQDGNVIGGYETTTIQLFHGASVMSISDFTITITATNISYSLSGAVITPSAFTSGKDSAQIAVKAILKTNTSIVLTAVYSITKSKAGKDGVIYSLQPSVSTFSKDSNGDWVTKSFYLYVKKTAGTGATEITTLTALNAEGLTLKYGSTTVTSSTLELVPSTICGSNTYADLYLYKGGVVIDRERINVVSDGTSSYVIDLTNENSSVLVSDTGAAISAYEQTSLVIYRGTNNVTSSFSVTFAADGITCTETSKKYTYSFSAITKDLANVTFTATNGSVTLKAIYTVARIKNGAIYSLICSHDTIHLDNTGSPVSTDKTMYLSIRKTTPEGDTTSTSVTEWKAWGVNVYYLDSGDTYTAFTTSNDISYSKAFASRTYASFQIRKTSDGTTILDSERVNAVSDGKPGPQGNPGPRGDDAVTYSVESSTYNLVVDANDVLQTTADVTISAYKQIGSSAKEAATAGLAFKGVTGNTETFIKGNLAGAHTFTVSASLLASYDYIRCYAIFSDTISQTCIITITRHGKPSFSLVDRGLFDPNSDYYKNNGGYSYKYENGTLVRDMVLYPIGNVYYRFMVKNRTDLTGDDTPVTLAPLAASSSWEQASQYKLIVSDVVYADNATLGGFHINQDSLWAGGNTPSNATVLLDGKNGTAKVTGEVNATSGTFDNCTINETCEVGGRLKGVTGTFKRLTSLDENGNEATSLAFGEQRLTFDGHINQQGTTTDGNSLRFYSAHIWCRGSFGAYQLNTVIIEGNTAKYYYDGLHKSKYYEYKMESVVINNKTCYKLPLYSPGTGSEAAGFPVDMVLFRNSNFTKYYMFTDAVAGKMVHCINIADDYNNTFILGNSGYTQCLGGVAQTWFYAGGSNINPANTNDGGGWLIMTQYDNDW